MSKIDIDEKLILLELNALSIDDDLKDVCEVIDEISNNISKDITDEHKKEALVSANRTIANMNKLRNALINSIEGIDKIDKCLKICIVYMCSKKGYAYLSTKPDLIEAIKNVDNAKIAGIIFNNAMEDNRTLTSLKRWIHGRLN